MYLDPKGRDASLLAKKLKEHIAESQSRKQKEGRKRSTVNWQRTGRGLAEEDQHLAPDRNERLLRKQKEGRKISTVAKELAEEDQVEHTVEHLQDEEVQEEQALEESQDSCPLPPRSASSFQISHTFASV